MSNQVQIRRGTTAEHAVFTGAAAELTINTDTNDLFIHDGSTVGGHKLVKNTDLVANYAPNTLATTTTKGLLSSSDKLKLDQQLYTKTQVDAMIAQITNNLSTNYYTKSQIDSLLANVTVVTGTTEDLGAVTGTVTEIDDYGSVTDTVTTTEDYGTV